MASQWYFSLNGQAMSGPCSSRELKRLASTGQLLPTDRVRKEGMEKPVRARRLKGLFISPAANEGTEMA
jgi:GYF domain 2